MDEPTTHRWVAGTDSARDAARSFTRGSIRRRRTWLALAVLWLLMGLYMSTLLDDEASYPARLAWGLLVGTVLLAAALPIGLAIGHRSTRRRFAKRIGPGTELTSRFGPSSMELAGPRSRHELSYVDVEHVRRVDDWVHLRQTGSPVVLLWPAALFPDHELERLTARTAQRG